MRLREKLEKENEREMTKEWGQRTSLKKNPFKRYLSLLLQVVETHELPNNSIV